MGVPSRSLPFSPWERRATRLWALSPARHDRGARCRPCPCRDGSVPFAPSLQLPSPLLWRHLTWSPALPSAWDAWRAFAPVPAVTAAPYFAAPLPPLATVVATPYLVAGPLSCQPVKGGALPPLSLPSRRCSHVRAITLPLLATVVATPYLVAGPHFRQPGKSGALPTHSLPRRLCSLVRTVPLAPFATAVSAPHAVAGSQSRPSVPGAPWLLLPRP